MPARAHAEDWDGEGFTSATCFGVLPVQIGLAANGHQPWLHRAALACRTIHEAHGPSELWRSWRAVSDLRSARS